MPYKNEEVRKEYMRQYRLKNKKKISLVGKKYYEDNKEQKKEYSKFYYEINKGQCKKTRKKYYQKNKKRVDELNRKRLENNKEKYKNRKADWQREYDKRNAGKRKITSSKRRELMKATIDSTTDFEKIERFYSLAQQLTELSWEQYVVDHIIPITKWWKHHQDNLQVITAKQNLQKWCKYPFEVQIFWNPENTFIELA